MIITNHALPATPVTTLEDFRIAGGMQGLTAAIAAGPDATIEQIGAAGVHGRGGAGFPTAVKWAGVRAALGPHDRGIVVVNAAEGEPGTFKDRALLRRNPYLVVEGALIAARTLGVATVVVATKARFVQELERLRSAVSEVAAAGWSDGIEISIVEGPDHYLFGEETAMLEVIEGEDPLPRHLPPYQYGLFTTSPQMGWSAGADSSSAAVGNERSNASLVNNVETYAHVALVMRHGAEWYASLGTADSAGPTIVTICGDVRRPIVAEIELGHPLGEVIDELAGGPAPGRTIKAVLSGVSNPVLTSAELMTPMSHEHLGAAGSGLGSAGFIVYDDRRNMIDVAYQVLRFLHVESCGQCTPCKTGTGDLTIALEQLVAGTGSTDEIVATIGRRLTTVTDGSRCFLPAQARGLLSSLLQRFPDDLDVRLGGAPGDDSVVLPKLVDLDDGVAVVDLGHRRKRPDWTYSDTPVRIGSR